MNIHTISGHLTATNKRHIKAILEAKLMEARINNTTYYLQKEEEIYTVKISKRDRGLIPCPGSALRTSINTYQFAIL